jgi:hydroxyethylthiazole kinase-like uncharacterized protein yjeF
MIELLTTREMAEADRLATASGISGATLMENAGRAVADVVAARRPQGPIVVVAGPGNNGGDGFVAARVLAERGFEVRVALLGERDQIKGDAAGAAARWTGEVERAEPDAIRAGQIIIDALFGAGLARPIQGVSLALVEAINAAQVPVVSVDLPSGICGDSGQIMGAAVKAAETVTFFRRKPGHLLLPGRLHCGRLHCADIGISAAVLGAIKPQQWANEPALWQSSFPKPAIDGHKYNRGHVVVVSGEISTGAAKLAARGALRAGAGLVTIASPARVVSAHAAESVAVMVRQVDGAADLREFLSDRRRNSIVLGPGGGVGEAMCGMVAAALASEAAVVLDADALTSYTGRGNELYRLIKGHQPQSVVLTPHEGEFRHLFNKIDENNNLKSKLEITRIAARESHAVVLFKGPDTVITESDGRAAITSNSPVTLATAGSGDVLAGIIAGLLAQGMPGFEAACAGAWLHGEAANEFGLGLISEDLPEMLPRVYRRLLA